jgi:hypothetical protein
MDAYHRLLIAKGIRELSAYFSNALDVQIRSSSSSQVLVVARSSNDAVSEWTRSAIKQRVIKQ